MPVLKLSVEQVTAAIQLLDQNEKQQLIKRLPTLLATDDEASETAGWLQLAESAFSFWNHPAEDIYNDLIPQSSGQNK